MNSDKKIHEPADNSWVPHGNGYEMTQSRQIIANRLQELKQLRIPIVLVHKNYQSGNSVLFGFKKGLLLIDKPLDWPGTENKIRIIYRDRNRLWNHFYSTVASTGSDTLYVSLPTRYFKLQRRENYRVEAPVGSLASFTHRNNLYTDIIVMDLSACGMLLAAKQKLPLEKGSALKEIMLTMPLKGDPTPTTMLCKRGEVVRATIDRLNKQYLFGIKFQPEDKEEEAIVRYVRQRELELLRKTADAADWS